MCVGCPFTSTLSFQGDFLQSECICLNIQFNMRVIRENVLEEKSAQTFG